MSECEPKPVWAIYGMKAVSFNKENIWGRSGGNIVCLSPLLPSKPKESAVACDAERAMTKICPGQAHHLSGRDTIKEWAPFLNCVLPFSLGHARGYLSLPRTLPAAGIRCHEKKGHGSLVSSSFTLVALTYICLHLLCIPRASVCSSSVCRAGFSGFWTRALLLCL